MKWIAHKEIPWVDIFAASWKNALFQVRKNDNTSDN